MHSESPARKGLVKAVLGPTNTGKTHLAVERMLDHQSGMIGLPLRLLAREVYDRIVAKRGVSAAALITGEEKVVPPHPQYFVCTVEAMPLDMDVDFLAVDEIQLAEDPERGHIFTDRLLNARGREETMLLGAETMRPLIKNLLPHTSFTNRPRFSNLSYSGPRKLSRLPRRSAIVAFSTESVYSIAELIRRHRGGAAVVMGALSPRTRNAQVALYQSGDIDFMVATDAIGMGLNMNVDHVAFASLTKFDGAAIRSLKPAETAQIAGRAGRYLNDGTFGTTADIAVISEDLVEQIENHRFDPIRVLQWRNKSLDFSSVTRLIQSLEAQALHRCLVRARRAVDVRALQALSEMPQISKMACSPASIRRLWEVCQIPDFRKVMIDEHVRLLKNIYFYLMEDSGYIPGDWIAKSVSKLDRVDGDLDTIANRIAHIRTWTFVANRTAWVEDVAFWRENTRRIEDKLSDALHQRLIQRFVDRRTSVLMKRLKENDELLAGVTADGEVTVEGEYLGRLQGLHFFPDPRVQGTHGKVLRAAAIKALEPEILSRAWLFAETDDADIKLSETGKFWWDESPIAKLEIGQHWLAPEIKLIDLDELSFQLRERVLGRLRSWLDSYLRTHLSPILNLRCAVEEKRRSDVTGLARGIGFQLIEGFGNLERAAAVDQIRTLKQFERATLRHLGVRFGEFSIYLPKLLKPASAALLALLWRNANSKQRFSAVRPPQDGLCSFSVSSDIPSSFYHACGYRPLGNRAVRIDILERLAELIRIEMKKQIKRQKEPQFFQAEKSEPVPSSQINSVSNSASHRPTRFEITKDMVASVGCSNADMEIILSGLGFRKGRPTKVGGNQQKLWYRSHKRRSYIEKLNKNERTRRGKSKTTTNGKSAQTKPGSTLRLPDSPFAVLRRLTSTDKLNEQ